MGKTITKLAILLAMLMSATTLVSCGGDEDEPSGGGSSGGGITPISSKRIKKMTWVEDDSYSGRWENEEYFFYDSQGRVINHKEIENDGSSKGVRTIIFAYEGNAITSESSGNWNNGEKHIYTLSNGRIIKDTESGYGDPNNYTYNYSYDNNGYIITQTFFNSDSDSPYSGEIQFTWNDGNLTKLSKTNNDGSGYTCTFLYSSIPWPKNMFFYWKGTNMEEIFEPIGAWGKMPKYLPSKMKYGDGKESWIDYNYTVENGLVTKVDTYYRVSNYEYSTGTCTIEWE